MIICLNDKDYEVDEHGFLKQSETWDERAAEDLASAEGLALTEHHWKVIGFLRGYWTDNGAPPPVRKVCNVTGFSLKYIYQLFPSGPAMGACKIAGLPRPRRCI